MTTINFYDLFSIANVPPRLENHHIWHSPRLYSTYFIKKMSHHLCKSARNYELKTMYPSREIIFQSCLMPLIIRYVQAKTWKSFFVNEKEKEGIVIVMNYGYFLSSSYLCYLNWYTMWTASRHVIVSVYRPTL